MPDDDPLVGIVSRAGRLRAPARTLDEEAVPTRQWYARALVRRAGESDLGAGKVSPFCCEGRSRGSQRVTCDEKKCWVLRVAAKNPSGVRAVGSYVVRAEPVSGTISANGAHGDQTVSSECDESRAGVDRGVPQMRSPTIAFGCEFYL